MADTTNLIIVAALLAGGAYIFMNRCQYLGMCEDGPMAPAPAPEPEEPQTPVPVADVGEDEDDPRTTIINNQYYPVQPSRPIIVSPPPRYPGPKPYPQPRPKPKPVEISTKCCKCKTTGYDNLVQCSTDKGRTWFTHSRYKYDLDRSMDECLKKCPKDRGTIFPWPWPQYDPGKRCDDQYCRQYPHRCDDCPPKNPPPSTNCPTTISRNGRTYKKVNIPMPQVQTAVYPPNYVLHNGCVYQLQPSAPTTTHMVEVSYLGVSL